MPDRPAKPGRLGVGILGAGKVGAVLGAALREAGHAVVGASGVSEASLNRIDTLLPGVPVLSVQEVVERSELVLIAVPDDALSDLVSGLAATGAWQGGQLVAHTAGRYGTTILDPARRVGAIPLAIHPAMTFTGTSLDLSRINGASFAVTAPSVALPIAQALVVEMGGEPVVVAEGDRALYHAALAHGANHLVTLISQALRVLSTAGIEQPDQVLRPLVLAALEGALRSGESELTGPVVRGDAGTVAAHRAALAELRDTDPESSDILDSYLALARATLQRGEARGGISAEMAVPLWDVLGHEVDPDDVEQ